MEFCWNDFPFAVYLCLTVVYYATLLNFESKEFFVGHEMASNFQYAVTLEEFL